MGTFTNSEDPDEMSHDAAFLQGLHCVYIHILVKVKRSETIIHFFLKL